LTLILVLPVRFGYKFLSESDGFTFRVPGPNLHLIFS
jgi:hypothetical protein